MYEKTGCWILSYRSKSQLLCGPVLWLFICTRAYLSSNVRYVCKLYSLIKWCSPPSLWTVLGSFYRIISFGELYHYGQTARGNFPSPPPNQRAVSMTVGPVQQMVWRGTRRARESPIRPPPPPPPPPPQHQAEASWAENSINLIWQRGGRKRTDWCDTTSSRIITSDPKSPRENMNKT